MVVWLNHAGDARPLPLPAGDYRSARVSPDGERIALTIVEGSSDMWMSRVDRNTLSRLMNDPAREYGAVWTGDGARIVFASDREGGRGLYARAADGTGSVTPLITLEDASAVGSSSFMTVRAARESPRLRWAEAPN